MHSNDGLDWQVYVLLSFDKFGQEAEDVISYISSRQQGLKHKKTDFVTTL